MKTPLAPRKVITEALKIVYTSANLTGFMHLTMRQKTSEQLQSKGRVMLNGTHLV